MQHSKLNAFCRGKIVDRFDFDSSDDISIYFADGSIARLSTLGGVEVAALVTPIPEGASGGMGND